MIVYNTWATHINTPVIKISTFLPINASIVRQLLILPSHTYTHTHVNKQNLHAPSHRY